MKMQSFLLGNTNRNDTPSISKNSKEPQNISEPFNWFGLSKEIQLQIILENSRNGVRNLSMTCKFNYNMLSGNNKFLKNFFTPEYNSLYRIIPGIFESEGISTLGALAKKILKVINTEYKCYDLKFLMESKKYNLEEALQILDDLYKQFPKCAGLMAAKIVKFDKESIQNYIPENSKAPRLIDNTTLIQEITNYYSFENLCLRYFILCEGKKDKEEAKPEYDKLSPHQQMYIAHGHTLSVAKKLEAMFTELNFDATDLLLKYCKFAYPQEFLEVDDLYDMNLLDPNYVTAIRCIIEAGSTPKAAIRILNLFILAQPKDTVGLNFYEINELCKRFPYLKNLDQAYYDNIKSYLAVYETSVETAINRVNYALKQRITIKDATILATVWDSTQTEDKIFASGSGRSSVEIADEIFYRKVDALAKYGNKEKYGTDALTAKDVNRFDLQDYEESIKCLVNKGFTDKAAIKLVSIYMLWQTDAKIWPKLAEIIALYRKFPYVISFEKAQEYFTILRDEGFILEEAIIFLHIFLSEQKKDPLIKFNIDIIVAFRYQFPFIKFFDTVNYTIFNHLVGKEFTPKEAMTLIHVFLSKYGRNYKEYKYIFLEDIVYMKKLCSKFPKILNFDYNYYSAISNMVQRGYEHADAIQQLSSMEPEQVYWLALNISPEELDQLVAKTLYPDVLKQNIYLLSKCNDAIGSNTRKEVVQALINMNYEFNILRDSIEKLIVESGFTLSQAIKFVTSTNIGELCEKVENERLKTSLTKQTTTSTETKADSQRKKAELSNKVEELLSKASLSKRTTTGTKDNPDSKRRKTGY